jgi:hypothetical protein
LFNIRQQTIFPINNTNNHNNTIQYNTIKNSKQLITLLYFLKQMRAIFFSLSLSQMGAPETGFSATAGGKRRGQITYLAHVAIANQKEV